jgi:pimeloyl-ACP methyl ester carboxylesterase
MANLFDYLAWRGDLSFAADGLNEVDALVMSVLAYIDFADIVPDAIGAGAVSLAKAADEYAQRRPGVQAETITAFARRIPEFLTQAAATRRYGEVQLSGYVSQTDTEQTKQFAVVVMSFGRDEHFLAFRGTDASIVGWKEDFQMSFMEIPAQHQACEYLGAAAAALQGRLWLGGHSKGGNLAIYAAAHAPQDVQDRIAGVYSNDGPGFQPDVIESSGYQGIKQRRHVLIPRSSVVGLLLEHAVPHRVVASREIGLLQHNAFAWDVLGTEFVQAKGLNKHSLNLQSTLHAWLDRLSVEQRAEFVDTLFDVVEATGARTIGDLNKEKLTAALAAIKAFRTMDSTAQVQLARTVEILFVEGQRTLRDSIRADIGSLVGRIKSLRPF